MSCGKPQKAKKTLSLFENGSKFYVRMTFSRLRIHLKGTTNERK